MFFRCGTGNEQVIQVGIAEGQAAKHLVNEALEGLSGVVETKGHVKKLKESKRCDYGSLRYVGWLYWDLMICSDEVQFAEDGSTV